MSAQNPTSAGEHSSTTATINEPSDDLTAQNQRDSPLLRLPPELRNAIHNLVMADNIVTVCGFAEDLMKLFDNGFTQQHIAAITSLCVLTRSDMVFLGLRRLSGLQRVTMASQHANNPLNLMHGDQLRKIMVRYMIKEINMLRSAEHVEVKVVKSRELHDMGIDWRDCPSPIRPRP